MDVEQAYALCERDARRHYENFPVASVLIPPAMRRHVAAVYAFARAADDFADEGDRSRAERLALLGSWRTRLHGAADGSGNAHPPRQGEPAHTQAIFLALGASIRRLALPRQLFDDLLSAFEQDVAGADYETWDDLLEYCRRSANPVGRLVLRIAGLTEARLDELSDAICSALQLTNFWQDFGVDARRGRLYLPRELRRAHQAEGVAVTAPLDITWRRALGEAVARTRQLFDRGRPLCGALPGRLRYEVHATWLGGVRVLDLIERSDFDVLTKRPSLGVTDAAWVALRLLR